MSNANLGVDPTISEPGVAPSGQVFRATVMQDVVTATDLVTVVLVNNHGSNVTQPPAFWPPRPDGRLPLAGDRCVVVADDESRPWVVSWAEAGGTGGGGSATPTGITTFEQFGAVGNGSTNDIAAIRAALASLAVTGGTVSMGAKNYAIDGIVKVPPNVNIDGPGLLASSFKCLTANSGVRYGAGLVGAPSLDPDGTGTSSYPQYGVNKGWRLDGNLVSTYGLRFQASLGTFENVGALKVNGDSVHVYGQNMQFTSLQTGDCAGVALVFDNGAGGNNFDNLHCGSTAAWHIEFRNSANTGIGYPYPEMNYFRGGIAEQAGSPSFGTTGTNLGCLHYMAGSYNYFDDFNFYTQDATASLVKVERNTVAGRSGLITGRLYFRNTNWTGKGGTNTQVGVNMDALNAGTAETINGDKLVTFQGDCFFSGVNTAIRNATNNLFYVEGKISYFSVANQFTTVGTNAYGMVDAEVQVLQVPTMLNSWVAYGSGTLQATYYKDRKRIFLSGLIKSGTVGSAAFTLPVGYRPLGNRIFTSISNNAIGRVDVLNTGDVIPMLPSSNAWVTLDGISFRAVEIYQP